MVLFGVTGDLASRKLIPALHDLACHGVLPDRLTLVGYGRKQLDDAGLRALAERAVDDFYGGGTAGRSRLPRPASSSMRYVCGEFDDPDGYRRLARCCSTSSTASTARPAIASSTSRRRRACSR